MDGKSPMGSTHLTTGNLKTLSKTVPTTIIPMKQTSRMKQIHGQTLNKVQMATPTTMGSPTSKNRNSRPTLNAPIQITMD